jgi:hypothetical protein
LAFKSKRRISKELVENQESWDSQIWNVELTRRLPSSG